MLGKSWWSCQGDESKCNFKEKREKRKMTTLEMMNEAERTGKTYKIDNILYNSELGFHNKNKDILQGFVLLYINDLFGLYDWEEDSTIYMTKSEAEEKYGIEIVED